MSSLLIKNALICDGLGRAPVPGDLLASEGKIIETAPSIPERALRSCGEGEVVDAGGAVLAPGFIDIHGHSDLEVLRHPDMPAKTGQGITTEVSGNCGAGVFPFKGNREQHRQGVKDILGTLPDNASWEWEELAGYRKAVEARRPASSLIPLQAHGALRYSCMENPGRPAADAELDRMEKELEISLEQGAAGFSTGLYYAPCCFARREELLRLCRAVARRGKLFSVHHRNEGAQAVESLEEILQVALEAGVKTQISRLKVIGKTQQHRVPAMLGLLEENRDRGLDVAFDQYPYLYGSTSLFSLLPPDLLGMAKKDMQAALAESANWREIERQIMEPDGWDSLVPLCGWEKIFITSVA